MEPSINGKFTVWCTHLLQIGITFVCHYLVKLFSKIALFN